MNERTLLLNADYTPIKTLTWQNALKLVYTDKASVVEEYDRFITHPVVKLKVPAVVALMKYQRIHGLRKVKLSSEALYKRDRYTCQYCGVKFHYEDLTKDHVIPRSHYKTGNTSTKIPVNSWLNLVTACRPCNGRKDARTPEECGMKLLKKPHEPTFVGLLLDVENVPEKWHAYIR